MNTLRLIGLAAGLGLALAGAASAQDITIGVAGPMTGPIRLVRRSSSRTAPNWPSPTSTPPAACSARSSRWTSATTPAIPSRRARSPKSSSADGVPVRDRPLLLRLVDPGLRRLCRAGVLRDHAGLDQSEVHRARHVEHVPRLRPRRPAGRGRRRIHRSSTTRARTSPSCTTRPTYGKGLADEMQEGDQQGRHEGEDV